MRQLNAEGMRPASGGALLRAALHEVQEGKLVFAENAAEAGLRAVFRQRAALKSAEPVTKDAKRES